MAWQKYKPLTVNDIAPYMGKTKRNGKELIGECPLCHKPNHLYASDGHGKLLVHCHHCEADGGDIIKEFIRLGAKGELIKNPTERKEVSTVIHNYCNVDGSLAFQKARRKYDDGSKEFRYVWSEDGETINYTKPENSINLYNLDKLAQAKPDTILYIVEGEKCADAMIKHGFLATTGHCGAKKKMNLTPQDKEMLNKFPVKVVIPDNDAKGEDYIKAWGNVYVLRMTKFWEDCPNKGDVADFFESGGDADEIHALEKDFVQMADLSPEKIAQIDNLDYLLSPAVMEVLWQQRDNRCERERLLGLLQSQASKLKGLQGFKNVWKAFQQQKATELSKSGVVYGNKSKVSLQPLEIFTGEWTVNDNGIAKTVMDANGIPKNQIICRTPIMPREILDNMEDHTQKVKITYKENGKWVSTTFLRSILASQTKILLLADVGIGVDSNNAKSLTGYFTDTIAFNGDVIPHFNSVSHMGWNSMGFIPYSDDVTIDTGKDMESLVSSVAEKGELQEWADYIRPLRQNLIVRIMICAAFASPLIKICGCLPFVVHVWGGTGNGKTVALMVAASVWGNPNQGKLVRSMNMTANNMMTLSATLHSIPLFGDELQTIKNSENSYDKLIMRFTEGIDRGRNKDGQTVSVLKEWNNIFVSTGEEPITNDKSNGGAKNRSIELECNGSLVEDGNKTANFVREHYGCAAREYMDYVMEHKKEIKDEYHVWFKDAMSRGNTTDKQAMAIALLALADKYSSELIFRDSQADPEQFYQFCKSKNEISQSYRAWEYVQNWIAENIVKFNVSSNYDNKYVGVIWGKQKSENEIWVNKNVLCEALESKGYVFNALKKDWVKNGWLILNEQGRYISHVSTGGVKTWCVHLKMQ